MIVVVDIIAEVVAEVSARLLPAFSTLDGNITGVHYLHGHPREILETLAQKDKSENFKFDKYPLICLFQDFVEKDLGEHIQPSLNIVFCKSTVATYKASERYEKNFKPYLYPMYEAFMQALKTHRNFEGYEAKELTKIDRLFWGRVGVGGNEKNMFNDKLDAIEIIHLKTNFKKQLC
jgi:hypothetical protein